MEAHEAQNKDVDPEVIQVVGLNKLDYSKIRVSDFCYLLNDRTDLTSNEYLKGVRPYEFQNVEMYDFIKFKTDNFDKYKFSLLIDDIRSFIPIFDAYFENDLVENVRVGFETSDGDLYSPEIKLHEFIRKVYVLRSGYFLHGSQFHLTRFSELAEELYQKIIDTPAKEQQEKEYNFADYLICENKENVIKKIRELDRSTPKKIYFILRALKNNRLLVWSDNETIYKAYYNEFSYHKSFDTLKRGLNNYEWKRVDSINENNFEAIMKQLSI